MICSEAQRALACRGPWDVVNLGIGWGLGKERAVEALQREARGVVVGAEMRRRSYRGGHRCYLRRGEAGGGDDGREREG